MANGTTSLRASSATQFPIQTCQQLAQKQSAVQHVPNSRQSRQHSSVTAVLPLRVNGGRSRVAPSNFPSFSTRARYSGASTGAGGGFSPIIATALAGAMGGTAGLSMMMILLALITFTATLCARET